MELSDHHNLHARHEADTAEIPADCTVHIVNFSELSPAQQEVAASWLHEKTESVENMLTVSESEVYERHMGLVALRQLNKNDLEIAGYIGAMTPEQNARKATPSKLSGEEMAEVGSLVVDPAYRAHTILIEDELNGDSQLTETRISQALVLKATQLLTSGEQAITPYAFCNEGSLPLFLAGGYREVTLQDVPETAAELCRDCALFDKCHPDVCCDTIVAYDTSD